MLRIYVGNLNFQTTEESLRELFAQHGQVGDVTIVADRQTGRPRGFGFVEMSNDAEGHTAIEVLNDRDFEGRRLTVNEARPRTGGGARPGGRW